MSYKGVQFTFFALKGRTPNMATLFNLFPKLPQEIRDAIWRECLPRRVIEIDWPTEEGVFDIDYEWDDDEDRFIGGDLICHLRKTSMINAKPPIISRVCRESRAVAFETGALLENPWSCTQQLDPPIPFLYNRIQWQWVDRARDTVVHLHFNPYNEDWVDAWKETNGNPIQLLRDAMLPVNCTRSISMRLLGSMEREESRDMVQSMSKILVCLKVVVLHTNEERAVQSGLFGSLGEERIVMVDPFHEKRIKCFRDFWRKHRNGSDELTERFFDECIASDPVQCRRTVLSWLDNIKRNWLRERWFDATGPWVREQDILGVTRWVQKFRHAPGLVQQEVWERFPDGRVSRYSNGSCWVPNQQHPWIRATYSKMPRFIPVVMFRLCTNKCHV